jgi:hypothetical protein
MSNKGEIRRVIKKDRAQHESYKSIINLPFGKEQLKKIKWCPRWSNALYSFHILAFIWNSILLSISNFTEITSDVFHVLFQFDNNLTWGLSHFHSYLAVSISSFANKQLFDSQFHQLLDGRTKWIDDYLFVVTFVKKVVLVHWNDIYIWMLLFSCRTSKYYSVYDLQPKTIETNS